MCSLTSYHGKSQKGGLVQAYHLDIFPANKVSGFVRIQSTTRIKDFLVVSIMSGILVGFVILVGQI